MMNELFDKTSIECRTYVLRLLNSFFFESATRLPPETIQKVFGANSSGRRLRFLLDTNFLFSLLSLHANPSNEAVNLLIDIIRRIPKNITVGLYVLPLTIDEFQRALTNYESAASEIRVTKNIVEAGIKAHLSGVLETYLERCRSANYSLTPDEYFSPYHENISAVLSGKGVEILQIPSSKINKDQRIIDDVLDRVSFYKQRYINQPHKQKRYEQVWHDVVLWYTVNDRRPDVCETFFQSDWVGVTIDYSLIAFDSHKRKGKGVPCMVHPAALAQALQILVPNDENMENALFSLMQLPFLFEAFDIEDEKATQKILGLLSRYENIDDLSVGTISELLGDRALKGKIRKTDKESEELTLIKEALIEHTAKVEAKHAEAVKEREAAKAQLLLQHENNKTQTNELTAALNREKLSKEEVSSELLDVQSKLATLEDKHKHLELDSKYERENRKLIVFCIATVVVATIICGLLFYFGWASIRVYLGPVPALVLVGIPVPGIIRLLKRSVDGMEYVQNTSMVKVIKVLDRFFWVSYGFIGVSILGPLIWESVKDVFTNTSP
jgi:hypothetical protein